MKITYFYAIIPTVRKGDEKSPKIKVFALGSFSGSTPKTKPHLNGVVFVLEVASVM